MIEALTPEKALDLYRANVEQFDQAAPILLADDGEKIGFAQIVDMEVVDGLMHMVNEGYRYKAVMLSSEARMRTWDVTTGTAETEAAVDDVVFTYADATGKEWSATQQFMRTNSTVRWIGDLEVADGGIGAVLAALRRLVGSAS